MIRQTTLIAILTSVVIGIALFALKYQVRDLESELTGINRQIIANREAIHVLHAEWTHLNDPDRLASLAKRLLQLQPVTPDRIGTVAGLPMAADVQAAALAAAAARPPAAAVKKTPTPQSPRGPAIAQSNDADELTRRIAEALADGKSPR
jgi:cell division protein FtsL